MAETTLLLDESVLAPVVSAVLNDTCTQIDNFAYKPIPGGTGGGLGLWRVEGEAICQCKTTPWSLVLKIVGPNAGGSTTSDWNYWRREACVYASGLLDDLTDNLSAPQCYAVVEQLDETIWIWLEDLSLYAEDEWSTIQYAIAARHLGQWNGLYLTGKSLPSVPWISKDWLRQWLVRAPGMEKLEQSREHPLVRRFYPDDVFAGYQNIWAKREMLLDTLAHLPQTFCHMDAFPNNLFIRPDAHGGHHTIAIDWAYPGVGAIGEELVALVWARASIFELVDLAHVEATASVALDEYIQGLMDAGWRGDPEWVQRGYATTSILRYGVGMVPVGINILTDPRIHEWAESVFGHPIEIMVDYWADVARLLLEQMDQLS